MKVYLDNCCFNRPFDNPNHLRIKLEAEAKLYIQEKIIDKQIELVWSYILEYENQFNPFRERKNAIGNWKKIAKFDVSETLEIISFAESLVNRKFRPKDALHIACSVEGGANYFLTTDDWILKNKNKVQQVKILNPLDFIQIIK